MRAAPVEIRINAATPLLVAAAPIPPPPACTAGTFSPRTDAKAVWNMLTSSLLNLMLICMPIGIWAGATGANPTLVFLMVGAAHAWAWHDVLLCWVMCCAAPKLAPLWSLRSSCVNAPGPVLPCPCCSPHPAPLLPGPLHQNFLALIPLALFLGEVTEDLALRFGDVVGGLLNATFGNVVEL